MAVVNNYYNCKVTQNYMGKNGELLEESAEPKTWTKWTKEAIEILKKEASKQAAVLDFEELSKAVSLALNRKVTAHSCRSKWTRLGLEEKTDVDSESDDEIGAGGSSIEQTVKEQKPQTRREIREFERKHGYSPVAQKESEYLMKKK